MTLRHRQVMWYGDQTKIEHIARLLKDPVLSEALELIFAQVRAASALAGADPAEILLRRQCELNGMQKLLTGLETLAIPLDDPEQEVVDAWSQYTPENPYQPFLDPNETP